MTYLCPVCGYSMSHPARDFHICPSCGTEFGYDDSGYTYEELRSQWIEDGARWWSETQKPPTGWNPLVQLLQAGLISFEPKAHDSFGGNKAASSAITVVSSEFLQEGSELIQDYCVLSPGAV